MFVRVRRVWRSSYLGRERFRKAFVRHRLASSMLKYARQLVDETKGREERELSAMGHTPSQPEDEATRFNMGLPLPYDKPEDSSDGGEGDGEGDGAQTAVVQLNGRASLSTALVIPRRSDGRSSRHCLAAS